MHDKSTHITFSFELKKALYHDTYTILLLTANIFWFSVHDKRNHTTWKITKKFDWLKTYLIYMSIKLRGKWKTTKKLIR